MHPKPYEPAQFRFMTRLVADPCWLVACSKTHPSYHAHAINPSNIMKPQPDGSDDSTSSLQSRSHWTLMKACADGPNHFQHVVLLQISLYHRMTSCNKIDSGYKTCLYTRPCRSKQPGIAIAPLSNAKIQFLHCHRLHSNISRNIQ